MNVANRRRALVGAVAVGVLGWAQGAAAQQESNAPASAQPVPAAIDGSQSGDVPAAQYEQGQDIIVTASKRQESLMSVPVSVTAVTGDQLVAKGIYGVQDLVKVTPGLSYVESGRSVPVFSLRGVGFFDVAIASRPTVSAYLDEAPIPFSIEAKGAAFDLERVEVLKGPQGTLFGQNATGGAINYIAAKPTSMFKAGVIASYARFDTTDVQGYVSGPLTPTLNARLAVRGVKSGDWQRSDSRDDTLGAQRFGQGRFLLDWHPTDRLTVAFNANGFYDGSDTQAPQYVGFAPSSPTRASLIPQLASYPTSRGGPRSADWDAGQDYRSHNWFYQLNTRVDYEALDALKLTSITSYSEFKINQLAEGDGTPIANFNARQRGRIKSFSQELRASGDVGAFSYIAGLNYAHDDAAATQAIDIPYSTTAVVLGGPPALPLDAVSTGINQYFDTQAVFFNLDYHLSDKLTLRGGVRYTAADLHYNACTVAVTTNAADAFTRLVNGVRRNLGLAPIGPLGVGQCASVNPTTFGTERYYSKLNQDNVSWRAGIDYKPVPGTLLYASVSKGYKAGSVSTVAATNDLQFTPVSQESVLAYEVGAKAKLFDRKVEITTAAFYYDYRDKQVLGRAIFQPNIFGAINALTNVPKSEIKGAEAQLTVYPVQGLTLTAAGTYLDTRVKGNFVNVDILGNTVNFKGDEFPYTPKWQIVLDGDYRFPISEGMNGTLGANANYRTKTTAGFGGSNLLDIDSYWLVDLRAGVDIHDGKYAVQVFGRNVTNKYYWTNVARSLDNVRRYAGTPASYGIQLSVRY